MSNQTANRKDDYSKMPGMRGPRRMLEVEKPKEGRKTLRKLLTYFAAQKRMLTGMLFAVLVVVVCSVSIPSLQSAAIDSVVGKEYGKLTRYLVLMTCVCLMYGGFSLLQNLISSHLSQRIVKQMREDLFDRMVKLPVRYLDSHSHGDLMSRMTNDVENIQSTVSQSLTSLFSGVLTIIGTVVMMVYYCWELALLSCITVLLTIAATRVLSKLMRIFFRKRQKLLGNLNGTVEEMVTNYKTVVSCNRQDTVIDEFNKTSDALMKTSIFAEILGGSMGPVMNCINNIGFVIIAAFGGYFALHGRISIGVISAFIVYAKQFGRPINELAQIYGQIETAIAGAERIFEIYDEPSEDKSGTKPISCEEGAILFRDVNFSYVPGKQVLKNFSLEVRSGHKVALVGATGSGKTTVVNLLMRFYDIDSGEILIDGVNIKEIPCDNLRSHVAIVLQDTVLFSDTIRNNLKYANPSATDDEMEDAARVSNCAGMVRHLKQGYDTVLSESGSNLSQGQRQLLSICRAFVANPEILILDEATSSVDTRTEKRIQDAMVKLMENRTSLIIAHRLSTIQDADFIVVMDQGQIVESGNHEELLAAKGRYFELYSAQFAGNEI